jgi:hypothetical protein
MPQKAQARRVPYILYPVVAQLQATAVAFGGVAVFVSRRRHVAPQNGALVPRPEVYAGSEAMYRSLLYTVQHLKCIWCRRTWRTL